MKYFKNTLSWTWTIVEFVVALTALYAVFWGVFEIAHLVDTRHSSKPAVAQTYHAPAPIVPDVAGIAMDVNMQRSQDGEQPLTINASLTASAQAKCADMIAKDYWAHDAPDGTTPWDFMKAQGIVYKTAGENLEFEGDNETDGQIVNAWMNSQEHRANILDASYDQVGYGICTGQDYAQFGSGYLVVQHFIGD